jgi:hypothetical protein
MRSRTIPALVAIAALAISLTACGTLNRMFGNQSKAQAQAAKLQELQQSTMRFADDYVGRMVDALGVMEFRRSDADERLVAQNWKLSQATAAYTIASGPNPVTNALDMVVLASLSHIVIEETWARGTFGERIAPLRLAYQQLEEQSWLLLDGVIPPDQQATLRELIAAWRTAYPDVRDVGNVRFSDFASPEITAAMRVPSYQSASLFSVLGLDPFANIDPAVAELAQTRQLAERSIYYLQRAPTLIDMQAERFTDQLAVMPEARALLAAVERTSVAAAQTGDLAQQLPAVIAAERQAAIDQIMGNLSTQEKATAALAKDLRAALEAGLLTSNSLRETIRAFDALVVRLQGPGREAGTPSAAGSPPASTSTASSRRPFDINDYTLAARQFAETSKELQSLIATLETGSTKVGEVASAASGEARAATDYVFGRALILLGLLLAGLLAVGIAYRAFSHWLAARPRSPHAG